MQLQLTSVALFEAQVLTCHPISLFLS